MKRSRIKQMMFGCLVLGVGVFAFCLPRPLFRVSYSSVLLDRNGELLGAQIASDGQWRFPLDSAAIPVKFEKALLAFEDKRFYRHVGIDVWALARAIRQNTRQQKVVSGASTLSMQVIRMALNDKGRTPLQKAKEMFLALRLDAGYRKREILRLYAAHAPFGGNVSGLEAASWRYFGKRSSLLSWAEAATLAVLPNSPALIHPGRNRDALYTKRNRLLKRLHQNGVLSNMDYELALDEPLPLAPFPLPQLAPHALQWVKLQTGHTIGQSTIDRHLQSLVTETAMRHNLRLQGNGIFNMGVLVVESSTGKVRAYLGNIPDLPGTHAPYVDMVQANRSTGSILKPILYAMAQQEGMIAPGQLLPDIPTQIGGFRPLNYYEDYAGAIPADKALQRSLNIPFVRLLQQYSVEKFLHQLQRQGLHSINRSANHYGLSLVVGGAESNLWQLCGLYASWTRVLNRYTHQNSRYAPKDWFEPVLQEQATTSKKVKESDKATHVRAGAIYKAFEAMQYLERPGIMGAWERFSSGRRIAWKTGTSFGFRDAWAIGMDANYVVGVWVGNADGEGRPGLVGAEVAAPVLFDVFQLLPQSGWFTPPYDDMVEQAVCRESGYPLGQVCPNVDTVWVAKSNAPVQPCPHHQWVHLDALGEYRVLSHCYDVQAMVKTPWFELPPVQAYYYRKIHPTYRAMPSFLPACGQMQSGKAIQLIFPIASTRRIAIPTDANGKPSETIFKATHALENATMFWHLDDAFLGETSQFHTMALRPDPGPHTLTLTDEQGNRLVYSFEVTGSK